jgi:hypothetical protein
MATGVADHVWTLTEGAWLLAKRANDSEDDADYLDVLSYRCSLGRSFRPIVLVQRPKRCDCNPMTTGNINKALQAEEQLAASLNRYVGQWVAIRNHDVVCHADTLRGLLDATKTEDVSSFDRILEVSETSGVSCFF